MIRSWAEFVSDDGTLELELSYRATWQEGAVTVEAEVTVNDASIPGVARTLTVSREGRELYGSEGRGIDRLVDATRAMRRQPPRVANTVHGKYRVIVGALADTLNVRILEAGSNKEFAAATLKATPGAIQEGLFDTASVVVEHGRWTICNDPTPAFPAAGDPASKI